MRTPLVFVLTCFFVSACSDSAAPPTDAGNDATQQEVADETDDATQQEVADETPEPVMCGDMVMLSSKEAMAKSPRGDQNAERLALMLTGELLASDGAYERVRADMAAISGADSATPSQMVNYASQRFSFVVSDEVMAALVEESFDAWDCINEWYGVKDVTVLDAINGVFLDFDALYHPLRLAEVYNQIPGLSGGEADSVVGLSADIQVCNRELSETHRYVYNSEPSDGVDCLAGCGPWQYTAYDVNAEGEVSEVASWVSSETGESVPEWYESDCLAP
jgi:hypothetical protein